MSIRPTTKHDIQRDEENITRPGFDVVTNLLVSGTLSMAYTGVDQGTGQVIIYSSGTPFDGTPYLLTSQFLPTLTGTISTAPSKNPPVGSDSVIIQTGERVTFTNLRTFFRTTYDTLYYPLGGWISDSNTWTCFSTDSPIYNVFINTNVTGTIGIGDRIQATQSGVNKYFLVHGVSITGSNTYLNLYGGTDYTLVSGSLTSPQYSQIKAPFGFPLNPDKWTVTFSDTSNASQSSPSGTVWYNLGSLSLSAPIGVWQSKYKILMEGTITAAAMGTFFSLSTSSNSESTASLTQASAGFGSNQIRSPLFLGFVLNIANKTTYFLIGKTNTNAVTSIAIRGDLSTTTVNLTSAYL